MNRKKQRVVERNRYEQKEIDMNRKRYVDMNRKKQI